MARGKRTHNQPELNASLVKYPRTRHMVISPGFTPDDLCATEEIYKQWIGKEVIATSKLDGEATTFGNADGKAFIHARSVDGYNSGPAAHTRDWMRKYAGQISHELPDNWRFCGENCYAVHSVKYTKLPTYFFLYNIWNEKNECLSWQETTEWANLLGVKTVPVLYQGLWDQQKLENLWPYPAVYGEQEPEGYVIRLAEKFSYANFQNSLVKWVRENHVAGEHWSRGPVTANQLKPDATPWPKVHI